MSNADDETRVPDASHPSRPRVSVVAGRYRIGPLIGRGGSGQVHQAMDELTGDAVAVKFVKTVASGLGTQLRRELTALRLLDLPGVVRLLDEGRDEEHAFLVMELLPGGPFDVLSARGGWATWKDEALAMLEALSRVHLAGVIHRDLKPGNILLDANQRPVLTDFGLAQGRSVEVNTGQQIEGSPRYMAPEQLRAEHCDARTDLYALGVMFADMLVDHTVPADVSAVISSMRSPQATDRPPSVLAVLDALGAGRHAVFDSVASLPEVSSTDQLRGLFDEPAVSFLHVAEDAAELLHRRTRGRRRSVGAELERWVRAGRCHWRGDVVSIDRAAVERLAWEGRPEVAELTAAVVDGDSGAAVVAARRLAGIGLHNRALALLDAVGVVNSPVGMETYADLCLQLGSERALRQAMYVARRSGAEDVAALLDGARLCWRGESGRAEERLWVCQPPAGLRGWRWGLLIHALGRVDSNRQSEVLLAAREDVRGDTVLEARWEIWAGHTAYARGDYVGSAAHHSRAVARLEGLSALRLAALTNGAIACLEFGALERARALASTAHTLAVELRSATAEVLALWIRRTAAYRSCVGIVPRPDLVDAARFVGPQLEARMAELESGIAWRSGQHPLAGELALRGAVLLKSAVPDVALLLRLLAVRCGVAQIPHDPGTPADPSLGLQIAALYAASGAEVPDAWPLSDWCSGWPLDDPDQRLDLLSRRECEAWLDQ